jgi:hypothetical protein
MLPKKSRPNPKDERPKEKKKCDRIGAKTRDWRRGCACGASADGAVEQSYGPGLP